jgi:hypothetical protein
LEQNLLKSTHNKTAATLEHAEPWPAEALLFHLTEFEVILVHCIVLKSGIRTRETCCSSLTWLEVATGLLVRIIFIQ